MLCTLILSSLATAGPASDLELANSWGVLTIGADLVQNLGNRGSGVKIGIIDSGIDYTHPELSATYAGGWDFVNNDNDPFDDYGHGTEVAGLIGAASNGVGMVGVAPEASLYAYKVFNSSGAGNYGNVIAALDRAILDGMNVVNLSFGSTGDPGQDLLDACDRAASAGVVVVASAGNYGGAGTADTVVFPGRYPSVIAVGATTMADEHPSFSSIGPTLDLVAPGVDLYTTTPLGGYTTVSGTSFSAPYVTGAAALLIHDGFSDIEERLISTALDLGPVGFDTLYGYGRLDVHPMAVPAPSAIALALLGSSLARSFVRRQKRSVVS
ncbi:MAG: S8 family peptidase [Phycisphaerales bacterium]